jgi:hypothetical protein
LTFVGLEPTAPAFLWKPLHDILNIVQLPRRRRRVNPRKLERA